MQQSYTIANLPRRPAKPSYSKGFTPIKILTNYHKVTCKELKIYQYSVSTVPDIDNTNRELLLNLFRAAEKIFEVDAGRLIISGRMLFGTKKPSFEVEKEFSYTHSGIQYKLTVKLVKTFDLQDMLETKSSKKSPALSFLNNCLKNMLRNIGYGQIGKTKKFFDNRSEQIPGTDLRIFRGYETAFNVKMEGLFLLVDAANKIVRNETVLSFINQLYKLPGDKAEKREKVTTALTGLTVMANYGSNKYYRVSGVAFDINSAEYRVRQNGLSIYQYYNSKYGLKISNKQQPLLRSIVKQRNEEEQILLIPEFCLLTGIPDDYDERKRMEISKLTIRPAYERFKMIEGMMKKIKEDSNNGKQKGIGYSHIRSLGIEIDQNNYVVDALKIQTPPLLLGQKQRVQEGRQASFQLFGQPLYKSKIEMKLNVITFNSDARAAMNTIVSTSKNINLIVKYKPTDLGQLERGATFGDKVKPLLNDRQFNIFWIIIPDFAKSQYPKFKQMALRMGVITQVSLQSKVNPQKKGVQSIITKILLQMATKIGNTLWVPRSPHLPTKCAIIAIDSAPISGTPINVLSFNCTLDSEFSSFYSNSIRQSKTETLAERMQDIIASCITAFQEKNSFVPEDVILIRNGCSDGQKLQIFEFQVKNCLQALKLLTKCPKLTFICIDKKPVQRFFTNHQGNVENAPPGTLLRDKLVSSTEYDFYMIAQQCGRNACVVPTYYKVLYNDSTIEENTLQQLLYSQCYNYMNWTGSVRVPASLQYATKLSKFYGTNLGSDTEIERQLNNQIYFI